MSVCSEKENMRCESEDGCILILFNSLYKYCDKYINYVKINNY